METKYQLKKLTPDNMICGVGACPNIYELTPKSMRCGPIAGCPAIYEQECILGGCPTVEEHESKYLIIGKIEDAKKFGLEKKIGDGEILISVPKKLIDDMKKKAP